MQRLTIEEIRERGIARGIKAFELRQTGKTYREIGMLIGRARAADIPISAERTRQIIVKEARYLAHPKRRHHPLYNSAREWLAARPRYQPSWFTQAV